MLCPRCQAEKMDMRFWLEQAEAEIREFAH
jgi:hypothetical protein